MPLMSGVSVSAFWKLGYTMSFGGTWMLAEVTSPVGAEV